jgi:hypothetical protein
MDAAYPYRYSVFLSQGFLGFTVQTSGGDLFTEPRKKRGRGEGKHT